MNIYKTTFAAACAFLFVGCSNEDTPIVQPAQVGDEVQFSNQPQKSRTVYAGLNSAENGLMVHWVSGDKIAVASPQCASSGHAQGLYDVNIGSVTSQNYANSLDKVGDAGVQWGTESTANFFAIYPADSADDLTINDDGSVSTHVTVPSVQVNYIPNTYTSPTATDGIRATYELNPDNSAMSGNFMYAQNAEVPSGSTVDLQFNPTSTVLWIKFGGFDNQKTGNTFTSLTINSITVTAPSGTALTGSYDVQFNASAKGDPTLTADNNAATSNSVSVVTLEQTADGQNGKFIELSKGESLSVKMLLDPVTTSGLSISDAWTVTIVTSQGKFTRKLTPPSNGKSTLAKGQVHEIILPQITFADSYQEWTFEDHLSDWIETRIPTNVYVNQLTLPGAWYAYDGMNTRRSKTILFSTISWGGNEGYQEEGKTIGDMFNAGLRAFQFEVRVGYTDTPNNPQPANGTIVISGTGRNQSGGSLVGGDGYVDAIALSDALDALVAAFPATSKEFCVVAINYTDGTTNGTSTKYKEYYINKLQSVLSNYSSRIYQDDVTPQTTVDQVQGKIIVVANYDVADENTQATTYPKALLAYTDMSWESSNLNNSLISPMKWASWPGVPSSSTIPLSTIEDNPDNLYLNYTLANRTYATSTNNVISFDATGITTNLATMAERQASISTIISNSDQVHKTGKHNVWYYVGAGGTAAGASSGESITGGPAEVAKVLNDFLHTQIANKITNNQASPLGMVFINQCTQYPDLIKDIFEMNTKFYLQNTNSSETGGTSGDTQNQNNYNSSYTQGGSVWD